MERTSTTTGAPSRRDFLGLAGAGASIAAAGWRNSGRVSAASRPNIILILADDLGYADLGVQGCRDVPTPNIDSIARNGVRFTNGYVSCPICSPTRAGLMTGRYQQRFGHESNPGPENVAPPNFGLPLNEVTLANRMKALGYNTGIFGKWHLGYKPEFSPTKRGFDEYFGFLSGAHSYLNNDTGRGEAILRGTERVAEKEYLTDAFAREAVNFIGKHSRDPFFVYLPFNAVHGTLQATERYLDRFANVTDARRRMYAGVLSALDDGVGRVLATVREQHLEEQTFIIFLSDNGGPTPSTTSRNDPLRGYKGQVLEGGIRIPFMMQWKGHLPEGKVLDYPVISLDLYPTAVSAVGGKVQPDWKLDGVDLLPYLTGKARGIPHETLYWRINEQHAIRRRNYKLLQVGKQPPELYDLAADIGEKNNLAAARPEVVKELETLYRAWDVQMVPPKWQYGDGADPETLKKLLDGIRQQQRKR